MLGSSRIYRPAEVPDRSATRNRTFLNHWIIQIFLGSLLADGSALGENQEASYALHPPERRPRNRRHLAHDSLEALPLRELPQAGSHHSRTLGLPLRSCTGVDGGPAQGWTALSCGVGTRETTELWGRPLSRSQSGGCDQRRHAQNTIAGRPISRIAKGKDLVVGGCSVVSRRFVPGQGLPNESVEPVYRSLLLQELLNDRRTSRSAGEASLSRGPYSIETDATLMLSPLCSPTTVARRWSAFLVALSAAIVFSLPGASNFKYVPSVVSSP